MTARRAVRASSAMGSAGRGQPAARGLLSETLNAERSMFNAQVPFHGWMNRQR